MKLSLHLVIVFCLLSGPGSIFADFGDQQPKLLVHDDPKFPFKMHFCDDERALFLIVVTPQGNAEDIRMLQSSRPDVESPFVDALLNWRFQPGRKAGEPVSMPMELPVGVTVLHSTQFSYAHTPPVGWGPPPRALAGLPIQFQYDQAPMPYLTCAAVYPRELLEQNIEGWATIAFTIDPTGRPRQFMVAEASRPEFGPPTMAMMATWQFSSPRREGSPCWAAVRMKQVFDLNDEDVGTDDNTERVLRALRKDPCPVVGSIGQLDAAPTPRYRPAPIVPHEVVKAGAPARAVIEIIIDRDGHAQLPRIVSATRDDFGWAAATAAGRWHFTVPTKNGDPVDVFARIPFEYSPPTGPRAAGAGVGLEGADERWGAYRPYLQKMMKSVRVEWQRTLDANSAIQASGNMVEVNLFMNSNGQITRILSVHPSTGTSEAAIGACVASIKACSPYGTWTDDMVAVLGKRQEMTLAFYYK